MEILKEILRIVTSKSDIPKVFPELDADSPSEVRDSLTGRYLNGMLIDKYSTDDEAAKDLYGKDQSDQRYRTLKSRTYERLLHSLLFLQVKQPEHSEYLSYYYKCTRNLICSQSLMRFASRTAGFAIAQKTLAVAQKYEFTDICLTLSVLLRETTAVWSQRKRFEYYDGLVEKYFRILEAEYRSDGLLDKYGLEMAITSRTKQYMTSLAEDFKTEIDGLVDKFGSHLLILNKARMDITVALQRDEPSVIIDVCNDAIEYLSLHSHLSQRARMGEFRLRKMMSLLKVRRYAEAFYSADDVVSSFIDGGNNWYTALYYAACASFLSENYSSAWGYISLATNHRRFTLLDDARKETWVIFSAYLELSEQLGLCTIKGTEHRKAFRLSTFLNSVPEESKSKKISNVLILISHVTFLILEGSFDQAEKRLEYLRVYVSRYLKEKHFYRVRIFIRLLQSLPRHSFSAKQIRHANQELLELLELSRMDYLSTDANEFIQYEILYESLLNFLEKHEATVAA